MEGSSEFEANSETENVLEIATSSTAASIKFPLPEHTNLKQCRDVFLRQILPEEKENKIAEVEVEHKTETYFAPVKQSKLETAEAMAILNLIREDQFEVEKSDTESNSSLSPLEKQILFGKLNYALQKASIEYALVNLLHKVNLCSANWPGDINVIPHKLFAWSVEKFLRRVYIKQTYLDVTKRNYPPDILDCYKFKIDCQELATLVEAILQDVREGLDVCKHSMKKIKTAYYDEHSEWLPECSNVRDEREQALNEMHALRRQLQMIEESIKMRLLLNENSFMQIRDPIEIRYRYRWTHDAMDQTLFYIKKKNLAAEEALANMKEILHSDTFSAQCSSNVYNAQIEEYKYAISEWEAKYEKDYEEAELVCTITQNSLQKVRDDEKFYGEQMEFFIKRIAEVKEEIRIEEEETLQRNIERFLASAAKKEKKKKKPKKAGKA